MHIPAQVIPHPPPVPPRDPLRTAIGPAVAAASCWCASASRMLLVTGTTIGSRSQFWLCEHLRWSVLQLRAPHPPWLQPMEQSCWWMDIHSLHWVVSSWRYPGCVQSASWWWWRHSPLVHWCFSFLAHTSCCSCEGRSGGRRIGRIRKHGMVTLRYLYAIQ